MLTECPECKRQVSDSAEVCPGCGYRLLGRENLVLCPRCKAQVIPRLVPGNFRKFCPLCNRPLPGTGARAAYVFVAVFVVAMIAVAVVVMVAATVGSGPTHSYTVEMSESGFGSHGGLIGSSNLTTTFQAHSESDAMSRAERAHPGYRVVRVREAGATGSSPGKAAASTRSGPARPSTATAKEVPRGCGER